MERPGSKENTSQNPESDTEATKMIMIACSNCNQPYPQGSIPYRCSVCSGLFDFFDLPQYDPDQVTDDPGIWRYHHTFGLPEGVPKVTLGEGDTPLTWSTIRGRNVGFKLEFCNPTHSFKDRGTAVLVSFLRSRDVQEAIDDSSGNAGASFAAYSARAGIKARVYLPAYASGPKRDQIEAYGADLVPIPGPRSKATDAVRAAADKGAIYASHALLPQGIPGYATAAFELVEQIGGAPGAVILPVGQGNLLLALDRGFRMLRSAGIIPERPQLVGVQARACAPLWTSFQGCDSGMGIVEGDTLAEGVRIKNPYRRDALLTCVKESGGAFVAVDEGAILAGQQNLAKRGFFVEPTSAIVWDGLNQVLDKVPDPVIVVLTGSGLKAI